MRRGRDSEFYIDEHGNMIGINLGADFCSEHEWGIKDMANIFNLNDSTDVFGVEKRRINTIPQSLYFKEFKIKKEKCFVLMLTNYYYQQPDWSKYKNWLPSDLQPYSNEDLVCAWDEESFGILVTKKYEKEIKELYQAFLNKDIALGISLGHAFKNGGLSITIISKLPKEIIDNIYEKDKDYFKLQVTAKATGIYELLDKAGKGNFKGYFALSPRWKDENKEEVVFWLNPYDQRNNNSGWYTVNDLKDWIEGKGKIPKNNM